MDEPTLTREQAWGWEELMVIAAFRYCLGRQTGIVEACAEWIVTMWPVFSQSNRKLIVRDLEEALREDDRQRAEGDSYRVLGDDCDRKAWEKVRALWTQERKAGE
jgi:hypothetical protein